MLKSKQVCIKCVATSKQSTAFFYAQYAFGCLRIFYFTEGVMTTVTFAGKEHLDMDEMERLYPVLKYSIEETILKGATLFLLGGCTDFDKLAAVTLRMLKTKYPLINSRLVFPHCRLMYIEDLYDSTEVPKLEPSTADKYAVVKRNWYMLSKSDCLITYRGDIAQDSEVGTRLAKYAAKHYPKMIIKKLEPIELFK